MVARMGTRTPALPMRLLFAQVPLRKEGANWTHPGREDDGRILKVIEF